MPSGVSTPKVVGVVGGCFGAMCTAKSTWKHPFCLDLVRLYIYIISIYILVTWLSLLMKPSFLVVGKDNHIIFVLGGMEVASKLRLRWHWSYNMFLWWSIQKPNGLLHQLNVALSPFVLSWVIRMTQHTIIVPYCSFQELVPRPIRGCRSREIKKYRGTGAHERLSRELVVIWRSLLVYAIEWWVQQGTGLMFFKPAGVFRAGALLNMFSTQLVFFSLLLRQSTWRTPSSIQRWLPWPLVPQLSRSLSDRSDRLNRFI